MPTLAPSPIPSPLAQPATTPRAEPAGARLDRGADRASGILGALARSDVRARLAVVLVATGLGLLESGKTWVLMHARGEPVPWDLALVQNMPWWLFWAALAPLAVRLARRARLDEPGALWHRVPLHLVAAFVLAGIHLVMTGWLYWHTNLLYIPAPTLGVMLRRWLENYIVLDMLTYGVILCAWYAVDYQRRFRASVLASAQHATRAAQLEHRMAEARLHALRMELNPHFLFNALNTIAGLVRRDERDAAVGMVVRLADLLRETLDRGAGPETSLGDELRLLQLYLAIERVRFSDRLTIVIDVPEALHDARVPTLALQPIVENAVRHGIARRRGPGTITILARAEAGTLVIEVRDTGAGLGGGELREGVGLSNTRARLAERHGARAGLALAGAAGGGTVARLWLPIVRQEETDAAR